MFAGTAMVEITIRVQSVLPTKADEFVMVKDFATNVETLTNGKVKFEVLSDGAIVSERELYNQLWKVTQEVVTIVCINIFQVKSLIWEWNNKISHDSTRFA
jgi:TRAP-type C4-dicarboxylate transport system substrate-binding protein